MTAEVRIYVKCSFSESDKREYTYHQDLTEGVVALKIGDIAHVPDAKTGGMKRVKVVGIAGAKPSFPTKPAELYVPPPVEDDANLGPSFDD
jgi:hypothetical protein